MEARTGGGQVSGGRGGGPTWADGAALTQRDILVLTHNLGAQDAGTIFVASCLLARHPPRRAGAGRAVVGGEGRTIRVFATLKITLRGAIIIGVAIVFVSVCKEKKGMSRWRLPGTKRREVQQRSTSCFFVWSFFCFVHHASYRQLLRYNYATCLECVCATTWKPPYDIPFFALRAGTSGGLSKPVTAGSVGRTPSLSLFTGSCGRLLLSSVAATLTTTKLTVWQQFRRQRSFSVTTPSLPILSHRG